MDIIFDTNEKMADELRTIVMKEIEKIATEGPRSEDIEKTREYLVKTWKNSLEQNSGWISYIQARYHSGLNFLGEYEKSLHAITNADVQQLAKKILADNNLVQVIMRPTKGEAK